MSNPLLFPLIDKVIDTVGDLFPSEEKKNEAKLKLVQAEQSGQLEETKVQLSAILAEANSADPITSRARPTFLYVIYIIILFGIPMGFLSAFSPTTAAAVTVGFKGWLAAIPNELYALFGAGYLGYVGARTYDKKSGVTK
jgi:hypothetical protein